MKKSNLKLKILLTSFVLFVLTPSVSFAARLYVETSQNEYFAGDIFVAELKIDTEENINVAQVRLDFSNETLEVIDFSSGNSIIALWVEVPTFSNSEGTISFVGGIPGNYSGRDGVLGKVVFRVKESGAENVGEIAFLDNSIILLDDQRGTQANLISEQAVFRIFPKASEVPNEEWKYVLQEDTVPPEPFAIELSQDSSLFGGRNFILFSTVDKQSGVDRYEVKEGRRTWKTAESPFLLENQFLGEEIKVRVIDKAGNERIQMIRPESKKSENKTNRKNVVLWVLFTVAVTGIVLLKTVLRRKRKT